ncbi:hypothetical protein CC1G_07629 [Coprinopsis cinerea okayama7|uniref:Uncharacterized protein n=1 Tax=Coprinopsis cinerea (strain Okayama-7 / 130 / ATCC MYA-4618 / FGSC 9003) TaxID=240176 RepID=D6RPN1_COPC7|nr:hypothetical protein CC1G_07629 [Coprinopsis cinerea okayama7\|eukprot:XP_002910545.1 hypothetical protein CC1G_07629 [Coprinopsis cinerea okayama7\
MQLQVPLPEIGDPEESRKRTEAFIQNYLAHASVISGHASITAFHCSCVAHHGISRRRRADSPTVNTSSPLT